MRSFRRLTNALTKTASKKKDKQLAEFGDVATPVAGALHPLLGALTSGLTDPGNNPVRTSMLTGLGSMAGIGGGGITGGLTGAALGGMLADYQGASDTFSEKAERFIDRLSEGEIRKAFRGAPDREKYVQGGLRLGGLLGALSGGALGSHWTRQVSKEFPSKKSRKKESNAKNRLKQAMILPSLGGGGVLLGKDDIPVQFQAGWGNLLGVLPVPEVGVRIGDESKGVSITGPIPGMGIDLGKLKGSSTYYRPGIPGMLSGEKDKDKKLFADDKSKKKKKKTKKTKASDKGNKK